VVDKAIAVTIVQVHDHFGIRMGIELMSELLQVAAQFDVVEDLAVEDRPDRFCVVVDRLIPGAQVDNAEPGMAESDPVIHVKPVTIGATVMQRPDHRCDFGPVRGASIG
jgi:hypothetical protein